MKRKREQIRKKQIRKKVEKKAVTKNLRMSHRMGGESGRQEKKSGNLKWLFLSFNSLYLGQKVV